jgi:lipase
VSVLHVHEWGDRDAPPVVCLHGVNAHGARFRKLAEERLASRFRVLAPDLRGHGRSTWEPPWTLGRHVADVREALWERGVERAAFIGHSFGGRLTLELTAAGVVGRSVLLDPAVWVPPSVALERAEALRADHSFASLDEAFAERTRLSPLAPRELLEEEFAEHLLADEAGRLRFRYSQAAVIAAYSEMSQPPPDWSVLQVPTLLVVGRETDVVPLAVVDALRFELGERLEVVPVPGRHIVLWDAFEETADAIEAFLENARA